MNVHEKIRSLREAKNWSQEEMAKHLNMSVNGYAKIERGETQAYIAKLEKIAEVLGVSLIDLIPQNGSQICLNSNNGSNFIGSSTELSFEVEKLRLIISHKEKELVAKDKEIKHLNEIITLLKNNNSESI